MAIEVEATTQKRFVSPPSTSPPPSPITVEPSPPLPEPWPPHPPDIPKEDIRWTNLQSIGFGAGGHIYAWKDSLALKSMAQQHEYNMMQRAGDCSVRPVARIMRRDTNIRVDGSPFMRGLLMERATPFDIKTTAALPRPDKITLAHEMIALVQRLHDRYGIVHGDVKPANMLCCADGVLRFCDFGSARLKDADPGEWEFSVSYPHPAPGRGFFEAKEGDDIAPRERDDRYALGISIWEMWTGKDVEEEMMAMDDYGYVEDVVQRGVTMDLDAIDDKGVRETVRRLWREGGATV